jgi:hypothetical protein
MAKAVSAANIQKRLDVAKKREAAQAAKKASTTAKPWKQKDPTTEMLSNQINALKMYVKIPIFTTHLAKIPPTTQTALGIFPVGSLAAVLGTGFLISEFKGNHHAVCRITIHPGLVTPISHNTSWGTRVTKFTDKSWSFPCGGDSISTIQAAFRVALAPAGPGGTPAAGPLAAEMGTPTGHGFATLHVGNTVLDLIKS